MVATPHQGKGLTADKVAKTMYRQWDMFAVLSVVTSDRGPQFASAWWHTLCASMGVRLAYGQAYHHQANGRVERAGQQIMELLRKLFAEQHVNWVEALPCVVDRIHDVKGESGMSPYQILFGRDRPLAGLPYSLPKDCEDAQAFFQRMSVLDQKVAQTLNQMHERQADRVNKTRSDMSPLPVGSKVWYRRPENSGLKLDSRWIGPAVVKKRHGDRSYLIEIKQGCVMKSHRSFLKLYQEPPVFGKGVPLFYFKRTVPEEDSFHDEYIVEKILAHRKNPKTGEWEFLTHWVGFDESESTWEPFGSFLHRINYDVFKYADSKKLPIDYKRELVKAA